MNTVLIFLALALYLIWFEGGSAPATKPSSGGSKPADKPSSAAKPADKPSGGSKPADKPSDSAAKTAKK